MTNLTPSLINCRDLLTKRRDILRVEAKACHGDPLKNIIEDEIFREIEFIESVLWYTQSAEHFNLYYSHVLDEYNAIVGVGHNEH